MRGPDSLARPHGPGPAAGTGQGPEAWAAFRVAQPQDRLSLLRALRDSRLPVHLNASDGSALTSTLWAVDTAQQRLNFSAEAGAPQLERLIEADEALAVAYLDNVKVQFDLHDLMLVRGTHSSVLQSAMPHELYRFQRRSAYRVRAPQRQGPRAGLRHPAWPEMALSLRLIDVSIGGCSLWLPNDVPPLQAGTVIVGVDIELDSETSFVAGIGLQHVASMGSPDDTAASEAGVRLGCEWRHLAPLSERALQRWIDRTQKRRRLLAPQ